MDRCERRNQSLIKRGKCDYVGPKAPSSSPLLCCRSHPPFVAASDRSSSLTYTDEINSTATERDALNKDQRQPKPQVAGGALCLCHPGGRQSVAAMTAATRRSSSMSSLYISSAYSERSLKLRTCDAFVILGYGFAVGTAPADTIFFFSADTASHLIRAQPT